MQRLYTYIYISIQYDFNIFIQNINEKYFMKIFVYFILINDLSKMNHNIIYQNFINIIE